MQYINGCEVETKLYLHKLNGGPHSPKIKSSSNKVIDYHDIIEEDGVNHLVLSREIIEAYIEASSKYGEVTDELNNFIDRLNRINTAEFDNLTEAQIDFMMYLGPRWADDAGLEQKRRYLRGFAGYRYFQSTNVFWIEEGTEKDLYPDGNDTKTVFGRNAIFYKRKAKLPSRVSDDKANLELPPHRILIPAYIPIRMQSPLSGYLLARRDLLIIMGNGR